MTRKADTESIVPIDNRWCEEAVKDLLRYIIDWKATVAALCEDGGRFLFPRMERRAHPHLASQPQSTNALTRTNEIDRSNLSGRGLYDWISIFRAAFDRLTAACQGLY